MEVYNLGRQGLQERLVREHQGHLLLPQACAHTCTHTHTHTHTSTHNCRARLRGQPHRIRETLTHMTLSLVGPGVAPSEGLTGESALIV